jgi:hypothetical protein
VVGIFCEDLDMILFNVDPFAIGVRILAFTVQPIDANLSFRVLVWISARWPDVDVSVSFVRFGTARRWAVALRNVRFYEGFITYVKEKIQAYFSHN